VYDLAQCHERTEAKTFLRSGNSAQGFDVANVDQPGRRDNVFLHQVEQIDAACLDRRIRAELPERFIHGTAVYK
jgi:hypothetical protein